MYFHSFIEGTPDPITASSDGTTTQSPNDATSVSINVGTQTDDTLTEVDDIVHTTDGIQTTSTISVKTTLDQRLADPQFAEVPVMDEIQIPGILYDT